MELLWKENFFYLSLVDLALGGMIIYLTVKILSWIPRFFALSNYLEEGEFRFLGPKYYE